jgi:hypothetical protein
MRNGSLEKHVTCEPKEILVLVGASVGSRAWSGVLVMTSPVSLTGAAT